MKKLLLQSGVLCCALGISSVGITADLEVDSSSTSLERQSEYHVTKPYAPKPGEMVSVIVKLDVDSVAAFAGRPGERLDMNSRAARNQMDLLQRKIRDFEAECQNAIPAVRIIHRFETIIGGVSVIVPADELATVKALPGVKAVYPDELRQLDTEQSPFFINADKAWQQLGGVENAGEGVIVGGLDSGIWPEHPSFADPDPAGKAYPAPPPTWTGSVCDFGNTAFNPDDAPFTCNNKLIGAYQFMATYKAVIGLQPTEFDSARDSNGHGSHTQSTSSGNHSVDASIFGIPRGMTNGIAPRAHVVMGRVCGISGCFSSDSAAAVQQLVADGVDIINFSIAGGSDPYNDTVSLAFRDAYNAGVLVTPSAGNSGPGADTVGHREPWTLTVGASTTDRHFISDITLSAGNGDVLGLHGASVTGGISTPTDVIFPPAGSELCLTPFAPGTFSGEIVICQRGVIARVAKSFNVSAGGAGGMLLYNPVLQGLATDNHFIPSVHLESGEGVALLDFMGTHTGVTATFTQGEAKTVQGDVMAAFSSRGGPGQTLGISKPDVTAPGVQILAAHSPLPEDVTGGLPGQLFQSIQGTSMSAPHVAGAAALVKAAHPDWGPGQIKSAIMMTARAKDVTKEDGISPADPFDLGSGRIRPDKAALPTATISETTANFIALEDELWNANYPSLYIPLMPGQFTVSRSLHNETNRNTNWKFEINSPSDVDVTTPNKIRVGPHGDASFDIGIDATNVPVGEVRHAEVKLSSSGSPDLVFPISFVRRDNEAVTLDKACAPATFPRFDMTSCTITLENTSFGGSATVHVFDQLPRELDLISGSVIGAVATDNAVEADVTLAPASPPLVNVAVDPLASPFGYFPLSLFGSSIDIGATDESIANFSVPSFDYAGESYNTIGIVSNGYVVVGGGTGADVNFINSNLPDPAIPNNVVAPFWTATFGRSSNGRACGPSETSRRRRLRSGLARTRTLTRAKISSSFMEPMCRTVMVAFLLWVRKTSSATREAPPISTVVGHHLHRHSRMRAPDTRSTSSPCQEHRAACTSSASTRKASTGEPGKTAPR
jgi:subtilisin family serine protease